VKTQFQLFPCAPSSHSIQIPFLITPSACLFCPQNGRWLNIDHGFPVRTIIPGYIGGRTIKWLCNISVTEVCVYVCVCALVAAPSSGFATSQ
jgi:DMSO/TMAO reductase YedYZ molybdopterin-dependent catalytic subunit